jgi:hypothetical protein
LVLTPPLVSSHLYQPASSPKGCMAAGIWTSPNSEPCAQSSQAEGGITVRHSRQTVHLDLLGSWKTSLDFTLGQGASWAAPSAYRASLTP